MEFTRRPFATYALALAILAAWCTSAAFLDQSVVATQRSRDLVQLGAADGNLFVTHEWWRLVVSQFLHVHFLHMLFNVVCIFAIGSCVEKVLAWHGLLIVYLVGGTAGQIASVMAYPTLISSGASQALMALSGAAIVVAEARGRLAALIVVGIQVALDLYVASTIKMGHGVGFGAGLLIGFVLLNTLSTSKPIR